MVGLLTQTKNRIVVLGASGMLGQAVAKNLSMNREIHVVGSYNTRIPSKVEAQSIDYFQLNVATITDEELTLRFLNASHVINCLGLIWQRANNGNADFVDFEIANTTFVGRIGRICAELKVRLIQVSTDCVFSGAEGRYSELSQKDAADPYGLSKSRAEDLLGDAIILRSSIVGFSPGFGASLLDWFIRLPTNEQVYGYLNHEWNGVTNLIYAQIVHGFIRDHSAATLPGIYHLVPDDAVNKYELLTYCKQFFGRHDLSIVAKRHEEDVDRTLITIHPEFNSKLWLSAGYETPLSIEKMISDLAIRINA